MAFEASFENAFLDPGTNALQFLMRNPMTDEFITVLVGADALRKLGGSTNPLEILKRFHTELVASASAKMSGNDHRGRAVYVDASDLSVEGE